MHICFCLFTQSRICCKFQYINQDLSAYLCLKASRRILQKAKLVRSPKSPKQLISPKKRTIAVSWGKSEEAALVQFIALFGELKKSEWPTFGAQHDYWEKAANFIQETARTNYKRSSKCFNSHFLFSVKYICSYLIK